MVARRRKKVAKFYRALLDAGTHRKEAMRQTICHFRLRPGARSTVYRWMAEFGIPTD